MVSATDEVTEIRPISSKEGMLQDVKLGNFANMLQYVNRQPKWNDVV